MHTVIVGYGRVGRRTARILREEGHGVTIVDSDASRTDRATDAGFTAVTGSGDDEHVLVDAGIETADAVGAFTPDLNVNFSACMIGDHHDCRTVLRIDEDYRAELYERYAENVDDVVYPERLGAAGAKTALLGGNFNVVTELAADLQLRVVEVEAGSPAIGRRLTELDLPTEVRVYAHGSDDEALTIPLPGIELAAGDELAVITDDASVESLRTQFSAA
ncbi:potassium channel family protein [Halovivax cerinus]|uniref:Potassium channel family protein n=1 Tax=Halovivax cerinus TaxID=1487865 RepID=A0ABD5NNZ6_9EURY|nr:TrkA family potassium uptake protein [Halovivax cerinus]